MTLRSHSLVWLRRILLLGAVAGASVGIAAYARWVLKVDPFARYRKSNDATLASQVGLRLEDVRLQHWHEGKLVLSCDIGRLDVRRDRQHMDFYDIHDGVYRGEKSVFHFAGPKANYNAGFQNFQVSSGARVWNEDLDLKADGVMYRQKIGKLQTQGAVKGRLFGGQIAAMNLIYYPETKMYQAGPIEWTGVLPKELQEVAGDAPLKAWDIKSKFARRQGGDIQEFTEGTATDGEIIVKAPKIEHNTKNDVLTATGRVEYFSKKANLVCERAVIYRKERRAVLTGNVTMLVKPEDQEKLEVEEIQPFRPMVPEEIAASRPKPPTGASEEQKKQNEELRSTKTARKYPVSIGAAKIEYWYKKGERRATITGSPEALQEFPNGRWRRMWTFKAFYDAEKETLKMVSTEGKKDTRIRTSIGDDLVATWFLTSTKEKGEDQWEGEGVEGTVISDDEDVNRRTNPPGTPPPGNLRGRIGGGR